MLLILTVYIYFLSVVVHPEHRGKGLGKFLMTKSEDHARR